MMHDWTRLVDRLEYALQPIVEIDTGVVIAMEALVRGAEQAGFSGIHAMFDQAYRENSLYGFDVRLRKKACEKFMQWQGPANGTLFYNLDPRVLEMPDYRPGNTASMMRRLGLEPSRLCLEVSERQELKSVETTSAVLRVYRDQGFRIALDDYGSGFSGLRLLYETEPHYLKIDRFFIDRIDVDDRKRLFVESIVATAHALDIIVIAEGVETQQELLACRQIGCDLVQGFLVARPSEEVHSLKTVYPLSAEGHSTTPHGSNGEHRCRQASTLLERG